MKDKVIKTPEYWKNKEVYGELTEVETAYGHKVMIPKKFIGGWNTAQLREKVMAKSGQDPLDGLENTKDINPLYYDLERVYFEIYEG